jgi:hypothetical protein
MNSNSQNSVLILALCAVLLAGCSLSPVVSYRLCPEPDISAFELALLMGIRDAPLKTVERMLHRYPDLRRHVIAGDKTCHWLSDQ